MLHSSASSVLPKSGPCLGFASSRSIPLHAALPSALCVPKRGVRAAPGGSLAILCMGTVKKRKRYRKRYPGEVQGIIEEMRFVAMRLKTKDNNKVKQQPQQEEVEDKEEEKGDEEEVEVEGEEEEGNNAEETWQPCIEGYLKYLVDSKLVFDTLDRIVDEASHVEYADFRNSGLERSDALSKDIEWFRQQGHMIPEPSSPGVTYAKYLHDISETSPSAFLVHFYNIYFAHISGGQVIGKQVSEKILDNRVLEFYKWEDDLPELLKDLREKLNKLGEHWPRDDKNKCLREASKSFKFSGQIIRLIIT